jgi:hypothetical protein
MPSPSVIDSVGHSGVQAPQAIQSSVIFIAMMKFSFVKIFIKLMHPLKRVK